MWIDALGLIGSSLGSNINSKGLLQCLCVSRPPNLFLYSNPWPDWHGHCACVQNTSILDTLATGSNAMQDYYLFLSISWTLEAFMPLCLFYYQKRKRKKRFVFVCCGRGLGVGWLLNTRIQIQTTWRKTQIKSENKRKKPRSKDASLWVADYMPKSWNDGAPCFPTDIQVFPFSFCYDTGIISLFL